MPLIAQLKPGPEVLPLSLATIAASGLLAVAVTRDTLSFGPLGAIQSFSIFYFAALGGFAVLAFLASERSSGLALYNVLLVVVSLWLVPALLGASSPLAVHVYEMYGNVNSVLETGHLDPGRFVFQHWPAWALEGASIGLITGPDAAEWVIRLAPFLLQTLLVLSVMTLSRVVPATDIFGAPAWILVVLLFSVGNWTHVNAFLPQGIAFGLLIVFMSFLGRSALAQRAPPSTGVVLLLTLFTGIVIAHLLTSLAALAILAVLAWRFPSRLRSLFFLAVVVEGIWTLYWSGTFFANTLPAFLAAVGRIFGSVLEGFRQQLPLGGAGADYSRIAQMRILYGLGVATLGFAGFATWAFSKRRESMGWFMTYLGLGMGILVATVAGGMTGGYALRIYTFQLLPFSYFSVHLARFKTGMAVILVALFVALPGHLVLQEGFQRWDHLRSSYLCGLEFFHAHTNGGTVAELKSAVYADPYAFGAYRNRGRYLHLSHAGANPQVLAAIAAPGKVPRPLYFVETSIAAAVFRDVVKDPETFLRATEWIQGSADVRAYDSDYVRVWVSDGAMMPARQ